MTEPDDMANAVAASSTPVAAPGYPGLSASPDAGRSYRQAYLQLVRFPNLFTAMADILAGYLIVTEHIAWMRLSCLLAAGTAIYAAGCVLNDFVDRFVDLHKRPQRPIPSGRIPSAQARHLAIGLFILGFCAALAAGPASGGAAAVLIGLAVGYNYRFKTHDIFGPLTIGACRAMNLLLGMSTGALHLMSAFACASLTFLYVAALTGISGGEVDDPRLDKAVKWMILGIVLLDAAYVAVLRGLPWALPVAACLLPAVYFGKRISMT